MTASDALGVSVAALDLTALPRASAYVVAQQGETWFFPYWHRDTIGGTATSNLMNGWFCPFR